MPANDNYTRFGMDIISAEDVAAFVAMLDRMDDLCADMAELNAALRRVLRPFRETSVLACPTTPEDAHLPSGSGG